MVLSVALLALSVSLGPAVQDSAVPAPQLRMQVDSAHHRVIVTAGPFRVPVSDPMMEHMSGMEMPSTPVQRFTWPVDAQLHGFHIDLIDGQGRRLPRKLMHHLIGINFGRRQLFYPAAERLFGLAAESEIDGYTIPKTLGVPLSAGQEMGVYVMWHNEGSAEVTDAYWRLTMEWLPRNLRPHPIDVLPVYIDADLRIPDGNTFDVPPGRYERTYEFTAPIGGHLLAVGGHLHDYGVGVRLEDAETGKVLVAVQAKRDSVGHVLDVSRKLLALRGEGLHLKANHRYRLVGLYDNPTRDTLYSAMAHMVGLFAPDDYRQWPVIDARDTTYQKDIADLMRATGPVSH